MKSISVLVTLGLIFSFAVPGDQALAGSASGTGIVKYSKADDSNQRKSLKNRYDLGIEYALDNKKFKSLVESFALSVAVSAGIGSAPADVKAIASTLTTAIRTAAKAEKQNLNDLDEDFALTAIESVSTAVVVGYCPSCGVPVGLGKIATSFLSAFTYGFFFGI